jgi:hypothetical protein
MKISLNDLEKFNKLYTTRDLIEKIEWLVIRGVLSSVAKYKILGIKGKM